MTRFWKKTLIQAFGVTLLLGSTSLSHAETLNSALTAAYNNSNLLEQNRALVRVEDEDVAIALSALRPQVALQSTISQSDQASNQGGGNFGSTVSLGLDLLLYDAGSSALSVEAAKETVLAARHGLVELEQQVLLSAVNAYVSVLGNLRVVTLRETNVRLVTQELRAAEDRFEVGEVTRTDVAQAEARLADARAVLSSAQGDLAISVAQYRTAIGSDPVGLTSITRLPNLPNTVAAAQEVAVRMAPEIKQAQSEIKANELNALRAEADIKPQISLNANVGHNSVIDNNSSVGLTMTVPLYQGGQLSALRRRALSVLHASKSNLNQQVLLTRQAVSDAWSQLAVSRALVQARDREIRAAQIAFEGAREEAKLGARTTLDVLDTEQSLADARTNRVIAETQVYAAAYGLLAATGMLTADQLGLPVERYDPSEYYNAAKTGPIPSSQQGKKLDRILGRYQKN